MSGAPTWTPRPIARLASPVADAAEQHEDEQDDQQDPSPCRHVLHLFPSIIRAIPTVRSANACRTRGLPTSDFASSSAIRT